MSRSVGLIAVVVALNIALSVPQAAQAAPKAHTAHTAKSAQAREAASTRVGTCRRTLAHYPVLHPGDRRRAVRTLQCALNDLGEGPVVVDGWYGPQTRAAVRRVERGFEGPAPHPGRINNGFWVLLFGRSLPDRDLHRGQHGAAVRSLQRAVRAAGGGLVVDGAYTPRTRRAVRAYQRALGLRVSGVVDEHTRFLLGMGAVEGRLN